MKFINRGYGEEGRGVTVSFQCQSPVLGAVLPNNSPGVHTLWLPAVALQVGLVLKPGSQEPWTPYRMIAAFIEAGIPAEAFCLYPGSHDVGSTLLKQVFAVDDLWKCPDSQSVRREIRRYKLMGQDFRRSYLETIVSTNGKTTSI